MKKLFTFLFLSFMVSIGFETHAQGSPITVTGTVIDVNSVPVLGANVIIEGTSIGATTDFDGKYSIKVPNPGSLLTFSYVGYTTQTVEIGDRLVVDVTLEASTAGLDEVVIVAFGSQKKISVVGAVSTIAAEDLRTANTTISTSLAGNVAGIVGVQRTGQPGADGASFYIRGVATYSGVSNYSKNGLPISKDPEYNFNNRYNIVDTDLGTTIGLNLEREPRFNAWISYHNSYYEVIRGTEKQVLTQYRRNDNYGIQGRSNNYTPTGYLNKKGVAPELVQNQYSVSVNYPWPVIRLGELYLNYAEALIEYGQDFSTAKDYIDKVRTRAGIPTIDEAWNSIGGANDKATLRNIVRQERTIELYLENHRFWDLRRWQIADQYLNDNLQGMNIQGETDEEFFQVTEVQFPRSFSTRNFLMPIPQSEINKNELLIQNPGY